MTMNVAIPALISVPNVVRRSSNLKKRAIASMPLPLPPSKAARTGARAIPPLSVPLRCLPCRLGRFSAVEHAELHLDVVARGGEGKALLLGLVAHRPPHRRELDDDSFVPL